MNSIIESLLRVIYPHTCPVCGQVMVEGERSMCMACRMELPLTGFHLTPDFNDLHRRAMHLRVPLERAAAMFYYERHSPYSAIIHRIKYGSMPSEGRTLAREYASTLLAAGFFDSIDALQPIPLSTSRLITRGYNQSHHIALGIADVTGLPVVRLLSARRHSSQTRKDTASRLANARGTYSLRPHAVAPAHVLLVDDVITTGATMLACAEAIVRAFPSTRISLLSLAASRLQ